MKKWGSNNIDWPRTRKSGGVNWPPLPRASAVYVSVGSSMFYWSEESTLAVNSQNIIEHGSMHPSDVIFTTPPFSVLHYLEGWLGSVMVRASDSQLAGCQFEFQPCAAGTTLCKLFAHLYHSDQAVCNLVPMENNREGNGRLWNRTADVVLGASPLPAQYIET